MFCVRDKLLYVILFLLLTIIVCTLIAAASCAFVRTRHDDSINRINYDLHSVELQNKSLAYRIQIEYTCFDRGLYSKSEHHIHVYALIVSLLDCNNLDRRQNIDINQSIVISTYRPAPLWNSEYLAPRKMLPTARLFVASTGDVLMCLYSDGVLKWFRLAGELNTTSVFLTRLDRASLIPYIDHKLIKDWISSYCDGDIYWKYCVINFGDMLGLRGVHLKLDDECDIASLDVAYKSWIDENKLSPTK
jgi:hypothetical protein